MKQISYVLTLTFTIVLFNGCNFTPQQAYKENMNWPEKPKIENCYEIQGEYLDKPDDSSSAWESGSKSAWAFGFPMDNLRLKDNTVKSRDVFIYFDTNKTLHINYNIDGQIINSRIFETSQYTCDDEGLEIVIGKSTYSRDDKTNIPMPGYFVDKASIYKVGDTLYVYNRLDTASMLFYVIPIVGYTERFQSFLVKDSHKEQ